MIAALAALAIPVTAFAGGPAEIKAYKRDPLPVYDDAGTKIRDVPVASMPAVGTPSAHVVQAKQGFVGVQLNGTLAWLRLSTVDYVGDLPAAKCVETAFAKLEEDGLQQSLCSPKKK